MIAAIESFGLSKRYRRAHALRDFSINIPEGRVAGLIGRNGTGKTTLINLCAGLARPTSGELRVLGETPASENVNLLADVALVSQRRPLFGWMTVGDLLQMSGKLNRRWDKALTQRSLEAIGIPSKRKAGQLSDGERAQVCLVLALGKRPRLLMLDEPFANVDPVARKSLMGLLLDRVAEDGTTVLVSSHDIPGLELACDYIAVMADGQLQVAGDLDHVLDDHRLVIGPRVSSEVVTRGADVVELIQAERETTALVRGIRRPPGRWEEHEVSLDQMVRAYMDNPGSGTLPLPSVLEGG